ncbi:holin [Rhodococcus phage Apiary]|nr:holin [Rhodococcus phage Braxoaddie]WNM64974.1 holin [Rhodococcus phage Maselop]WNM67435.1 holin [Rhodococcus phage Polyyuki]WNM69859.1 holin [Rhodococcus phage Apiary]
MSEESGSPATEEDSFPSSRFSKKQRRYVYELVRTGLPLLGLAGVAISPEVATAVMAFSMTVLGLGGGSLAISHLSD